MGEQIGRVVVIEDEQPVRDAVLAALRAERFTATAFEDLPRPADVLALAPDLAILDVLLPSGNGFELARSLRQQRELPIIFLTARDAVADRVAGLELGADDYLVKPFALEELMAPLRAVLRRRGVIPEVMEIGRLLVDEEHGFAARADRELALTLTKRGATRAEARAGARGLRAGSSILREQGETPYPGSKNQMSRAPGAHVHPARRFAQQIP
jgi:two-component system OmpR family response regulator